jgi:hypothetical protein
MMKSVKIECAIVSNLFKLGNKLYDYVEEEEENMNENGFFPNHMKMMNGKKV